MAKVSGQFFQAFWFKETPSLVSGKTYALTYAPIPNGLDVRVDGRELDSTEYTLSGLQITLTTALVTGQSLFCKYPRLM